MPNTEPTAPASSAPQTSEPTGETITVMVPPPEQGIEAPKALTEDDIARARQQERETLTNRLESQQEVLDKLATDLQQREAKRKADEEAAAEAQRVAEEEAERKRRSELTAKTLLAEKEKEWEAKLADLQKQIAERDALAAKEREFAELQSYRSAALAQAADNIAPELQDLVTGNTKEEIDESIAAMAAKSAAIVQSIQAAQTQARAQMRGTQPTGYGIGPGGAMGDTRQLSVEEISTMPMSRWAEVRKQIPGIASSSGDRGMFG
ncbi:hypothetical protein ADL22_12465 [Streptomyces sp. NRRL F-4489]|uniref:hypothetical protein n=1 Tax=Streptomyces sp. NRRL F-4489 TaxID=1609095 RepID=UPI00074725B8|nr:hypothetical protein [Streptomyces sp. NRRL F-4489]KUL44751.1 hypothetical protein ADL22_12465 [Streptomyces sp. NRRL F-4489]